MVEKDKNEKDMEQEYALVAKKYSLPDFAEIDREFQVGPLEQSNFVLRSVIAKMADRTDFVMKIINTMIQPENRLSDMQEAEHLSAKDRQNVMDLFKKLSYYEKEFLINEFDYTEAACAAAIKQFHDEWQVMKPQLISILKSMQDTWKGSMGSKQEFGYFG